jgi:O-antigen/teichoic acid export membrane protein
MPGKQADISNMDLRRKTIQGGAFLALRQGIGITLSLIGVLLVTRIIGPSQYGVYAVGTGIVNFLCTFGTWGLDVCLLRKTGSPEEKEFHQAFTLLLCISVLLLGGLVSLTPLIARFVKISGVAQVITLLAASIPLNLLTLPATVKLDRDLNFKQVAINELIGQVCMYAVAIPLAFAGTGAKAPATGFVTQQLVLAVLNYRSAGYHPALHWETGLIRQMLKYGLGYSSSIWVWQLRNLVNPLVVGRYAGAEAVGYVAVSIRIVTILTFAKSVTWRIAMAALANMGDDSKRLRKSITEGMRLQTLATGFPLAMFALAAPLVVPRGFGHNWIPALSVFPFIGLSYLSNAMFNLHSSVLYLLGKNFKVTVFHVVHMILFASSAILLVPRLGVFGYGWAEVAALLSYVVIHAFVAREIGSPSYGTPAIWFTTAVAVFAFCALGAPIAYFGALILLLPLLLPKERTSLIGYAQLLFSRASA